MSIVVKPGNFVPIHLTPESDLSVTSRDIVHLVLKVLVPAMSA